MSLDLEMDGKRANMAFLSGAGAEAVVARCPRVAALLPLLADALEAQAVDRPGRLFDLAGLDDLELMLIKDVTGEGEVAASVSLPDGVKARIQESVMTGMWRVSFCDAEGRLVADYLEIAPIPEAVRRASAGMTRPLVIDGIPPAGAIAARPLLAEIEARIQAWRAGEPNHIITLTLLPVSADDIAYLQQTLGDGPVTIESRGYGSCRVLATATRHVWSVQFTNASGDVILDTLEIGDVPAAACAAAEDFQDSAIRLRQIEQAYFA